MPKPKPIVAVPRPSARTRGYSRSREKARAFSAPAPLTRSSPAAVPLSTALLGRLRGWLAWNPYSQDGAERGRSRFLRLHSGPRTGSAYRDDAYVAHSLVLRSLTPWPPLPWPGALTVSPASARRKSSAPTRRGREGSFSGASTPLYRPGDHAQIRDPAPFDKFGRHF
ncbi:MAG: hypothetical protein K0R61_2073 [Microvirga sp.]|jgi:hypothetical protein|nr:hypothetical protein [Microvirga sp.]MDF2971623.1 hypothetical protein [Microvirga sp.]